MRLVAPPKPRGTPLEQMRKSGLIEFLRRQGVQQIEAQGDSLKIAFYPPPMIPIDDDGPSFARPMSKKKKPLLDDDDEAYYDHTPQNDAGAYPDGRVVEFGPKP